MQRYRAEEGDCRKDGDSTGIERKKVEIEGGIEEGQLEIQAEEDDILREIKKGNRRERKEEEDRRWTKNNITVFEESSGEGNELETQEKDRKQRRRKLGRGVGRDKTEYEATISEENRTETAVGTE